MQDGLGELICTEESHFPGSKKNQIFQRDYKQVITKLAN